MTDQLPCNYPCKKCGSVDVFRRYFGKGDQIPSIGYGVKPTEYATGQYNCWKAYREHLLHECRCCGYKWSTLPMKKPKTQKVKPE